MKLFNFSHPDKNEKAIQQTWEEFRNTLAKGDLSYCDTEKTKQITFLRVFDDWFHKHDGKRFLTKTIHDLRTGNNTIGRGTILSPDETPDYERFLPKSQFIKNDNRFSPAGTEWLYLAIGPVNSDIAKQCAIHECRAARGNRFGFCSFVLAPSADDLKIVDLTIANDIAFKDLNQALENYGQTYVQRGIFEFFHEGVSPEEGRHHEELKAIVLQWSVYTYAKLMSEQLFVPVDATDKRNAYIPFHALAQYFISLGFSGIVFNSTVFPKGKNVVLFDKRTAIPTGQIEDIVLI